MFWERFDHGSRAVSMKLRKYLRGKKKKKDEIFIITSNSVGVH